MIYFAPKHEYIHYGQHRFGWKCVMRAILSRVTVSTTISNCDYILDDWFEKTFRWAPQQHLEPYTIPFITFMHDPILSQSFRKRSSSLFMTRQKNQMRGLLTRLQLARHSSSNELNLLQSVVVFSHYHARQLHLAFNRSLPFTLTVIPHPVFFDDAGIDEERSLFQPAAFEHVPRVFFIGWWLRRYDTFLHLNAAQKIILLKEVEGVGAIDHVIFELRTAMSPRRPPSSRRLQPSLSAHEINELTERYNIRLCPFISSSSEYDEILKSSVIFIDVYDASANNVVLECIYFCTPLLACRHPAIIEYLGEDYPFYFSTLREANLKIASPNLIWQTHVYLRQMDKAHLHIHHFVDTFKNIQTRPSVTQPPLPFV